MRKIMLLTGLIMFMFLVNSCDFQKNSIYCNDCKRDYDIETKVRTDINSCYSGYILYMDEEGNITKEFYKCGEIYEPPETFDEGDE